ncbi:MAG: hypothetical protein Kow0059_21950 [Candidatus Sumerlaeia bacterium]
MTQTRHRNQWLGAGLIWALFLGVNIIAPADGIPAHIEQFILDSREPSPFAAEGPDGSYAAVVTAPGAPWMRVKIAEYRLSPQSYLTFTSVKDGSVQRQTALTLPQWGNMSAFFNGDAVIVELHRAPIESSAGDYFIIEDVVVGEWATGKAEPVEDGSRAPASICGSTDDRVPSTEARPARLTFVLANGSPGSACTAWPVSNGAMLTAGHCVDFDPDGSGPNLPDGVLDIDANDVIEFNPPASTASGTLQFAPADDQYSMDLTSFTWSYNGEGGQSVGLDFAVFRCNPNPNHGQTPAQRQGFYRMTNGNPAVNDTIRITGYGTDSTPDLTRNQVQQTHTGPYVGETVDVTKYYHEYQVDTTGGNSGSPILWSTNGYTIGIHTNAGCGSSGGNPSGANAGTSFEHDPLENALQNFPGTNTRYVDLQRYGSLENGTIFHPHDTVSEGISATPNNGRLIIVRGTYSGSGAIFTNKPMLIQAPVGSVLIQP